MKAGAIELRDGAAAPSEADHPQRTDDHDLRQWYASIAEKAASDALAAASPETGGVA